MLAALLVEGNGEWLASTSIKHIAVGGEPLDPTAISQCRRWLPHVQVMSGYGPTEATVRSAYFNIPLDYDCQNRSKIPLGRALPNTSLHVVDTDMKLVPPGVRGEIVIAGVQLARGYLNQPELTAERFAKSPPELSHCGARIYHTGDHGYWTEDGLLMFLGRKDGQLKLRGQRLEAEEVEGALNQHPSVHSSAVVVCKDNGNEQLIAYYTKPKADTSTRDADVLALWTERYDKDYDYGKVEKELSGEDVVHWISMLTGERVPPEEMREWLEDTIQQIAPFASDDVLEVGVGTGQIALGIINRVKSFFGTDISSTVLDYLGSHAERNGLSNKLTLAKGAAHELHTLPKTSFSLVIINSVVQYFPSVEYLTNVLGQILEFMPRAGRIFLGDIRSYSLIPYHNLERALATVEPSAPASDIAATLDAYKHGQSELLVSPGFFFGLQQWFPSITHVEIKPKLMRARNEFSRYRYSVVLHIHDKPNLVAPSERHDLGVDGSIDDLKDLLLRTNSTAVEVTRIPIPDLDIVASALAKVERATLFGSTASSIQDQLKGNSAWTVSTPAILGDMAKDLHWSVTMDYSYQSSDANYLRAVFVKDELNTPFVADFAVPKFIGPLYSTVRVATVEKEDIQDSLKEHLCRTLPEFMIPSRIVLLEELPLNASSKLNRSLMASPNFLDRVLASGARRSHTAPMYVVQL